MWLINTCNTIGVFQRAAKDKKDTTMAMCSDLQLLNGLFNVLALLVDQVLASGVAQVLVAASLFIVRVVSCARHTLYGGSIV